MRVQMKFVWFRWRLLVVCLVAGLVLPTVTLVQALHRATQFAQADEVSADYLREATLSPETLGALGLWALEIGVLLYAVVLLVLFVKERRERGAA
jgi:hypothetical protein